MRAFHCSTRVVQGQDFAQALVPLLAGRAWALVTSHGWRARGAPQRLEAHCGAPAVVLAEVASHPTVADVLALARALPEVDTVVALGGGSVLDTAKALVTLQALGDQPEALWSHLRERAPLPAALAPRPLIAVPTTSGTGSEVTPWATLWAEGAKYSLSHPSLLPTHAVLDAALCMSAPYTVTLTSGLDALSHALEAVWNRHHSPLVDALATEAIRLLWRALAPALAQPQVFHWRQELQTASLLAGLAMGTTQTALAHSISYPFTARFGVPHGLACSFTLAEVARYNAVTHPTRLVPIAAGLGCALGDVPEVLEQGLAALGLGTELARYVTPDAADTLGESVVTVARAGNNVRPVDAPVARQLARTALERLRPAC